MITIRPVVPSDAAAWLRMRLALWPEESEATQRAEVEQFFDSGTRSGQAALLAEDSTGQAVGFAELSIRSYAEGCLTGRVAYLEGWYVEPEERKRGVGRALVEAGAEWGRARGCTEFASDALAENAVSAAAHRAIGFTEVCVVRCFRRDL
jgi:aminoglycoside 6'-N-acetyltransferase I